MGLIIDKISGNPLLIEVKETELDALQIQTDATYTYIKESLLGTTSSEALWRIQRLTVADNTLVFVDGNTLFDNIWNNIISLIYS